MHTPLLLIGTAHDGPDSVPILINSIEQAYAVFGGMRQEYITLASNATGVTLTYEPISEVTVRRAHGGELVPYQLYSLSCSGTQLTFEAPGENIVLVASYLSVSSSSDLCRGYAEALTAANVPTYLLRVGTGTLATCNVPVGNGATIDLSSIYKGTLYNTTKVNYYVSVGGAAYLVLRPPAGKGACYTDAYSAGGYSRAYRLTDTTTVRDLAEAIELDWAKGYHQIRATYTGSADAIVSISQFYTDTFSGGNDEVPTAADYANILDLMDLSNVKVVSILGKSIGDLSTVLTEERLAEQQSPTLFVQEISYDDALTPTVCATALVTGKTTANWLVSLVAGEGRYDYSPVGPYWGSLAPAYAALVADTLATTSRKPIGVTSIRPVFSGGSIAALSLAGIVTATKSISNNYVVTEGVTSKPRVALTTIMAYAAVVKDLQAETEKYIGASNIDRKEIESIVHSTLDTIPSIRDFSFTVNLHPGQIVIDITLYVVGELKTINFSIGVKTNGLLTNT